MKVGIVGLGIAGLRAAMLLEKAGIEVVMFEARERAGGRIHCVDQGDGVLYEAGGEWLDSDHHRAIALLKEFGQAPEPKASWPQRLVYNARQTTEDLVWNEALEDDLRVEAAAREMCRDLRTPPWENEHLADLDEKTLEEFVRENAQSERGLWWVTAKLRSDEGDDLDKIGLLGWLSGYLKYLDRDGDVMSAYRFPGGSGQLIEKMLASLKGERHFGKVLERVQQNGNHIKLIFADGEAEVDRVIVTLPPPCLERVVFEPALSVGKRCAIEACRMSRAVKISWHFSKPWWKDIEWGGSMLVDNALQQTWDGTMGEGAVLTSYVCGNSAVKWCDLGDPVAAGLYELSQMFPEAKEHFVRGWFHDWVRDPYSQGAFSHLAPRYVLEHMESIAPNEDKIYFAGEHTSEWVGFIEGALESAERVVQQIQSS